MVPGARTALRRIGRSNDVVTYVSRYARRRISAALGPFAAMEYLPPGVRVDTFRPDPAARTAIRARHGLGSDPVVVSVSRLVPRKGQDTLIRAMPAIVRRVPLARLLIVGDGPAAPRLHQLVDDLELADRVQFTGSVPASQLPAYYCSGDVFAMPCRTRGSGLDVEGLGMVFLEASASGLPVIAGRSGGAPETVQEGRTGLVVDGRNVAEVAEPAVTDLLIDRQRALPNGGANGRAWVSRTGGTGTGPPSASPRCCPPEDPLASNHHRRASHRGESMERSTAWVTTVRRRRPHCVDYRASRPRKSDPSLERWNIRQAVHLSHTSDCPIRWLTSNR